MTAVEPGDTFLIEYGNGRRIEVRALTLSEQRKLAKTVRGIVTAEEDNKGLYLFDMTYEALVLCLGEEKADELSGSDVDAELAIDIASKTLGKQQLSEDERKKPESSL